MPTVLSEFSTVTQSSFIFTDAQVSLGKFNRALTGHQLSMSCSQLPMSIAVKLTSHDRFWLRPWVGKKTKHHVWPLDYFFSWLLATGWNLFKCVGLPYNIHFGFYSVAKSRLTLWPLGLQPTRLVYSPLSPRVCSISYSLHWWCYLKISSSSAPLPLLPSVFPSIRVLSNESTLRVVLKYFIKDVLYHMLNYYSIMLFLFGYWKHTISVLFFLKYWT